MVPLATDSVQINKMRNGRASDGNYLSDLPENDSVLIKGGKARFTWRNRENKDTVSLIHLDRSLGWRLLDFGNDF